MGKPILPAQRTVGASLLSAGVAKLAGTAEQQPFKESIELTFTFAASTTSKKAHGLGRVPKGWLVVDVTGQPNDAYRSSWDADYIELTRAAIGALSITVKVY